jgi:hypothetical protein
MERRVKRIRRRLLFWIIAGLLIAIFGGSILLLRSVAVPQRYKGIIEERLRGATGREVWIRGASLRFLGGIGIEFEDVVIKDWDGKSDFIRIEGLILQIRLLPLLRRQLRWKSLILLRPSLRVRRSSEVDFHFRPKGKGVTPKGQKEYRHVLGLLSTFTGGEIWIRGGSVDFSDESLPSGSTNVGIDDLYVELKSISVDAPVPFRVRARQPNPQGPSGRVRITGELRSLPNPFEPSKIEIAAEVRAKNLNPRPFWPYYGPSIPMKRIEGLVDIHAHYEGNFMGLFRSRGQIRVKGLEFDYGQVFETVLKPREFMVDYDVRRDKRNLIVSNVSLGLPEIEIRGRCSFTAIGSPRRRIEAFATTGSFRFDGISKYIPYRILSPGLATVMREVTREGSGKIVSLRIDGPIADFSALKDPEKGGLIYGKMRLDGANFPCVEPFHPIEDISGWAILEKGSLRFLDLKGSYGRSVVNAPEVIISRIYSSAQLNLGLKAEIDVEGAREIARPEAFLGKGIPVGDISGRGSLDLTVVGSLSGPPSALRYNGHLVLERSGLSIMGVGLPFSDVSGDVVFTNDRIRLVGVRGKVGDATIWANGEVGNPWLGKAGRDEVNLFLRGDVDLRECLSRILPGISPRISQAVGQFSEVSGRAAITLELVGRGRGFRGMSYKGRLSLGDAVFRWHGMVSPFRLVKGSIDFDEKTIRFSGVEARSQGSYLKMEGSVRDYPRWKRSKIDLHIRAPNLDAGDFRLKKGGGGEWIWRGGMVLPEFGRIVLQVDEGKWRLTSFSNLIAHVTVKKGRLSLEKFHFEVKGGAVDLTAWLDLDDGRGMAFSLNPNLSHVDAGRLFKDFALEKRVWITGDFNLWGSLKGSGRDEEEVRQSLEGNLNVRMEKGRIRRFNVLSKIFSLLNVSQLIKGKLPELTGEGLPYNGITGEIGIAKGVARTENLLVDSNAMKIGIIGEADLVREELDLTVSLHPMGTVDTIVSKVPVVGRILAGEDESVISYYVKVTGDFSNPKVKHIPFRSMEKGLIQMIRRLLESPMHIIPKGKEDVGSVDGERGGFPEDGGATEYSP